jgi:hypothetical protein
MNTWVKWLKILSPPHCQINESQFSDLLRVLGLDPCSKGHFRTCWTRYMNHGNSTISTNSTSLLPKAGTSKWQTCANNQMWLLTWNGEAVTCMLVWSWEFPKSFSSQAPITISWDSSYYNKWLSWKISSGTNHCAFPDIQSFCSEEPGYKMIQCYLIWVNGSD